MSNLKADMYSIRDEYAPKFGRQVLTLWEGGFAACYVGQAVELPKHNGYMITPEYGTPVRVECESPRTDTNWMAVDSAISAALEAAGA